MTPTIIVPGIGGSGPDHWQTLWEARRPGTIRLQPASWEQPDLADWILALERAVASFDRAPVLLAHSLGCLLVAHWAELGRGRVAGAFLVAPPDPAGAAFPQEAAVFRDPPRRPFPFPSMVVASADDPYASLDYASGAASAWGAGFVDIGRHGHINAASNLGDWPEGAALFRAFEASLSNEG